LEGFGRWNNLRENWSHVVDNPNQLAYLQSILNSSQIKQNDINVDNALVPVHVVVLGKGPIKDDNLIYEWTKTQVADIEMGEACDYDPHKFFDSDSDTPMETNEKPTIHFKRKIRQPKLHEDDG
jgi:hypothetical protein